MRLVVNGELECLNCRLTKGWIFTHHNACGVVSQDSSWIEIEDRKSVLGTWISCNSLVHQFSLLQWICHVIEQIRAHQSNGEA